MNQKFKDGEHKASKEALKTSKRSQSEVTLQDEFLRGSSALKDTLIDIMNGGKSGEERKRIAIDILRGYHKDDGKEQ